MVAVVRSIRRSKASGGEGVETRSGLASIGRTAQAASSGREVVSASPAPVAPIMAQSPASRTHPSRSSARRNPARKAITGARVVIASASLPDDGVDHQRGIGEPGGAGPGKRPPARQVRPIEAEERGRRTHSGPGGIDGPAHGQAKPEDQRSACRQGSSQRRDRGGAGGYPQQAPAHGPTGYPAQDTGGRDHQPGQDGQGQGAAEKQKPGRERDRGGGKEPAWLARRPPRVAQGGGRGQPGGQPEGDEGGLQLALDQAHRPQPEADEQ